MRTDPNRLLVGGAQIDDEMATRTADPVARRQLIEIIVGLLIVGACLYLFVPVFMGTAESARRTICVTHLRRLAQAVEIYQGDHDGQYPPAGGWMRSLYSYVVQSPEEREKDLPQRRLKPGAPQNVYRGQVVDTGAEVFFCPSEDNLPRRRHAEPGTTLSSYTYRPPMGVNNSMLPFAWDLNGGTGEAAHPNGGNVAYLDGRVRWRAATQWAATDQP